jgi:hypothetical protein
MGQRGESITRDKKSPLLGVSKLRSLLVTRQKDNTKLILGRFKCKCVDSIGFVNEIRHFFVIE